MPERCYFSNRESNKYYADTAGILYLRNYFLPKIVFLGGTYIFAISQNFSSN